MSELIAEARVLVTPDTTAFRSLLTAQVAAASKGVTVPVTVTPVVSGVSAAAQRSAVAGANAVAESTARIGATTASTAAVRAQFARTEEVIAAAEKRAAVASTEAAAAQTRYNAALVSSAAAQRAYRIALTTSDEALTLQAGLVVAVTQENEALALSQLNVARTAQTESAALNKAAASQSAALGGVAKGGTSAAASLLGVRGATLAATGPFIAGAAGAIALGKALSIATGFTQQLSVFAATTGATADELDRVSASAQQLGKDLTLPGVSASDAAEAMKEFAKAGLSVDDAITAARGGLQLATAAQLSNAEAVEITASALNAFKLSGDQAVSVADTLANAANAAQGSISDIALGLKQASGAAAAVGVSFEDTTALLTLLAKNGLTASDAGTALRTSFIRLVNPSKKAQEILKDLNINLRDAQGNLRPEVFREFANAQSDLAVKTQQANSAIVFGQDAFRVIGLLGRENADALDKTRVALDKQGTAAKVAGAQMVGLAGSSANLKNQLEGLGLTIGQVAAGPLTRLTSGLADLVGLANSGATAATKFFESFGAFDATNANLPELTAQLDKLQDDQAKFVASGGFVSPQMTADAKDLQARIAEIGKAITDSPAGLQKFIGAFASASPKIRASIRDGVITPLEDARLSTTALGRAFLQGLPQTAFVGLGAAIRSGIEDSSAQAKAAVADTGAEIASAVEDAGRQAVVAARNVGVSVGKSLADGFAEAARSARLSAGSAASDIIDIQFRGGSSQQQLAGLRKLLASQNDLVDVLVARKAPRAKIDAAKEAAISTQNQIDSVQKSIDQAQQETISKAKAAASAREQRARDAEQEITRRDQAALDALVPAQNRIDLAQINANATARLSDDIRVQVLIAKTASQEIAVIEKTVKDVKTRNTEIARRVQIIAASAAELDRLRKQVADAATERRKTAASALQEALGKQITLAGLRENKQAEVTAINKAIANAKTRIANYKKLGLNLVDEKIALEELINQRDEVLKAAKKPETDSTSVFELLKQNAETFNQTGGNLVTGNQPFAGPTGFTADIAQFLHRPPQVQMVAPKTDVNVPLITSNAELIRVIQENTDAIRGGTGSNDPASAGTGFSGAGKWWARSFYASRVARQLTEAG